MNDDFFPDGAAKTISEVVDFVHHDEFEMREQVAVGVQHVSKNFGRHDHDARASIDVGVAGQQTDVLGTPFVNQLVELLVAERLHGRCVKEFAGRVAHGEVYCEFGDDGLAGTSRSCDEHASPTLENGACLYLKRVEVKIAMRLKCIKKWMRAARFGARISLGRRGSLLAPTHQVTGSAGGNVVSAGATSLARGTPLAACLFALRASCNEAIAAARK
ncbi:unannotated protein [freshwater metagenome]|uniref:Unannotated protein n=1 Tax=freshwater metagenome TaxID=449393 RepID=A0A6J6E4D1_9ZZZZ